MSTNSINLLAIIRKTFNLLGYKVVDHGERVAYILYKLFEKDLRLSKKQLFNCVCMALLHDIGAFKTEDIDILTDEASLMDFEYVNSINHSIYGYLFIKNFSPLEEFADSILYHHTPYNKLLVSNCANINIASGIFTADRIDLMLLRNPKIIDDNILLNYKGTIFPAHTIDQIIQLEKTEQLSQKLASGSYFYELTQLFDSVDLSNDEIRAFLRTIAFAVDFRSEHTVMHTISVVALACELAKMAGIEDVASIYYGALLHDIGKLTTSVEILEKSGALDDYEFGIMRDHAIATEKILQGCVSDKILKIAARHHEKLDGSGYPHSLKKDELSQSEQLMAVADILSALAGKRSYKSSFSSDKIKGILLEQSEKGKISPYFVDLAIRNYDELFQRVDALTKTIIESYTSMMDAFYQIKNQLQDMSKGETNGN